jgi:antitoxin CcdA
VLIVRAIFEPKSVSERRICQRFMLAQAETWLEENRAALDSSNAYVEAYGLPLEKHRLF